MNFVPPRFTDEIMSDAQLVLAEMQLVHLAELREMAMNRARALDGWHRNEKLPPPVQAAHAFAAIAKAVRQIVALEQETIGLREKRLLRVRRVRSEETKAAVKQSVKQSVERSIRTARPDTPEQARKRLLSDLFDRDDTRDYRNGNVRDIVADICKTLGVEADLSIWEQPSPQDIHLPTGHDWVIPANGDKPYTTRTSKDGFRGRLPYDSPLLDPDYKLPDLDGPDEECEVPPAPS